MKKYLIYAMRGEKMCFIHALLNALELKQSGCEVKLIFEGQSVTLPVELSKEEHPLYKKAVDLGIIAGVCLACAKTLGSFDAISKMDLPLLSDMSGHAGITKYVNDGYNVLVF